MKPLQSNLLGAAFGLLAMGLFACSDITTKFLGGGYNPFQIIFFAGLMTFPLIFAYALADRTEGHLRPQRPGWMVLRCVVVLLNGILGTYAFTVLPLAQCYAIFFTMPIFITLLAVPMLGEKIDLVRGLAVVAGLVGVVVALDPGTDALGWGHVAALTGSALGALNYVLLRKTGSAERTVVLLVYPLILQMIVAGLVLPQVYQPMPLRDLGLSALMATVTFLGYLSIIAAYRRAPGIVVAPMQYSQIIWAAIFGALLFGEHMTARALLGTAVIILAGLLIVTRRERAV